MLILVLSLVGLLVSSYFTAVSYRWIEPDEAWIPSFCRMSRATCASIVDTPRARVFGIPNSVLGQIYYLALLGGLGGGVLFAAPFYSFYLLASGLTVLLAVYLTYSLLFWTRVPCILCLTSHAINVVLFITLLLGKPG